MKSAPDSLKKERLQVVNWLIEQFPSAFFKQPQHVKPLQIGVFDAITAFYDRTETPPFSKKKLREALNYYTASPAYLRSQKTGEARVDIYGSEIDVVTEDQARYAFKRWQARYSGYKTTKTVDEPPTDN